ncbi:lanthionine synthetase C family protein [Actinokineospora sp. UTMC 2448]|uniref:lanthionine synthetase C family protein n=1 Tax=Actinokineospora sp. UTMC 2448 TaxID=2268449 RepID=UPI002164190C|nr:lanthionine synthetase C family protein [Actinokineospora sp. UTMC 2448]UVS80486.1 Nisin biosynthesis protein NisC [Actinokineospora sp. UTMC 2448]
MTLPEWFTTQATEVVERIAARWADPAALPSDAPPGSLGGGAAGIALLHTERARTGHGDWATAHAWLARAIEPGADVTDTAGLFTGAPALAFVLHSAADDSRRYQRALRTLDAAVADLTYKRLRAAHQRMEQGRRPAFAEYDLIQGLTGLGCHHLRRDPRHSITGDVLAYLVRLTQPLAVADTLPPWWVHHAPNGGPSTIGGHGNLGLAHGIAGPLALLAIAARQGVVVDGHIDAIHAITDWLDRWRQPDLTWPEVVTATEIRRSDRPSWCYGTPGVARAHQLAAVVTGRADRRQDAEGALLRCIEDSARLTESGLCHGTAGFIRTAWRAAQDSLNPDLADVVTTHLAAALQADLHNPGLLRGASGVALNLHTLAVETDWDRCLALV